MLLLVVLVSDGDNRLAGLMTCLLTCPWPPLSWLLTQVSFGRIERFLLRADLLERFEGRLLTEGVGIEDHDTTMAASSSSLARGEIRVQVRLGLPRWYRYGLDDVIMLFRGIVSETVMSRLPWALTAVA